jgi:SAM-dependent methyltransferase
VARDGGATLSRSDHGPLISLRIAAVSLWGRIFAAGYDRMLAGTEAAGLGDRRRALLATAQGSVIEVGAGTGVNLAHYPRAGVDELVLVEPEEPMAKRLERRLAAAPPSASARVVRAPAEALPLPDASFDVAVCTLVLCTVRDPARALAELHRVLKPDGRLLFLEHVRAEDPGLARWQDRLDPLWMRVGHGCRCNRDTLAFIRGAGFAVDGVEHGRLPKAAAFVKPMIVGTATALSA